MSEINFSPVQTPEACRKLTQAGWGRTLRITPHRQSRRAFRSAGVPPALFTFVSARVVAAHWWRVAGGRPSPEQTPEAWRVANPLASQCVFFVLITTNADGTY